MIIAICDDNLEFLNQIGDIVTHTYKELQVDFAISSFTCGQDLLAEIQDKKTEIELLLLDIDMPGISGLDVAKVVRETGGNTILIFISSYENFVFETFEYNPFRFVRKSRMKQELPIALRAAEGLYQKNRKRYVVIKCDEGELKIEASEITHFEVVKRRLHIHLSDGRTLHTWKTLKELLKEVSSDNFSKIHSGCVVNLKYVSGYSGSEITMDSGVRLVASRDGMKTFKEELSRYWSR